MSAVSWTDADVRRVLHHLETMAAEVAKLRKVAERVAELRYGGASKPRDLVEGPDAGQGSAAGDDPDGVLGGLPWRLSPATNRPALPVNGKRNEG